MSDIQGDTSMGTTTPTPIQQEHELLQILHQRIAQLETAMASSQVQQQARQSQTSVHPGKEPKISSPPPFSGRKDEALEFLLKCDMVFDIQPHSYATTKSKIAFVTNLLKDEAYRWVMPFLTQPLIDQPEWIHNWALFKDEFKKSFGDTNIIETSRQKLKVLKQTKAATSYATEFRRLAAYLNWGDEALRHPFFDGLKEDVKDKILTPNNFTTLNELIDTSVVWDNLLYERRKGPTTFSVRSSTSRIDTPFQRSRPFTTRFQASPTSTSTSWSGPVPMEIDAVRPRFTPLTPEERKHRMDNNLCLYCGKAGHTASDCHAKAKPRPQLKVNVIRSIESKNSKPQA